MGHSWDWLDCSATPSPYGIDGTCGTGMTVYWNTQEQQITLNVSWTTMPPFSASLASLVSLHMAPLSHACWWTKVHHGTNKCLFRLEVHRSWLVYLLGRAWASPTLAELHFKTRVYVCSWPYTKNLNWANGYEEFQICTRAKTNSYSVNWLHADENVTKCGPWRTRAGCSQMVSSNHTIVTFTSGKGHE